MTIRRLKVAVVGASMSSKPGDHDRFAVRVHLPVLHKLSELFEVVAVCTTRMETASATARHFQVAHAYDNVERMLRELPEIDAVCVSVRPAAQHAIVMAALQAGKHVYCEHPMGCSLEQAQQMYELAKRKNLRTVVGHEHHYDPAMLHMAELIREGYVGRPLTFNIVFFNSGLVIPPLRNWMIQPQAGGHPAWRTGHSLERATSVLGDVSEICANMAVLSSQPDAAATSGNDQMNNVNFLLRMANNAMGTLQVSLTAWFGTGMDFQIYGSEGMLVLSARQGGVDSGHMKLYGRRADVERLRKQPGTPALLKGSAEEIAISPRHTYVPVLDDEIDFMVAQMWHAFAYAIQTGTECTPSFKDSLKIHCVWDASERSMRDQAWAKVDYSSLGSA